MAELFEVNVPAVSKMETVQTEGDLQKQTSVI